MTSRSLATLALTAALAAASTACHSRPFETTVTNPISPTTPIVEDQPVSVFGTVESVTGQCPTLTITINGVAVKTNTLTVYSGTGSCAGVRAGDGGGVTGQRQSDGSVV